jgi:hypothetical protein
MQTLPYKLETIGIPIEINALRFSSDYVSGRMMKTDIKFESGGLFIVSSRPEGES